MTESITADGPESGAEQLVIEKRASQRGRRATDDQRLHELFWNRADLKKQYSSLRDDLDDLKDKLKKQEAQTQRARDDMRALENILADQESAYNAIVYYQLRALWHAAHAQIEKFAEELENQQKDRERKKQIMEFNLGRQKRLTEVGQQIVRAKADADLAKQALQEVEAEYDALSGIFNFFKRRKVAPRLEEKRRLHNAIRESVEELFDKRIKLESEPWPEYPGLTTDGRRVINLAVIALAQHLYVHFSENSLGSMARTTTIKRVQECHYGKKADCEYLMTRIREAVLSMQNDRNVARQIKARSKYLKSRVEYRNEKDSCPSVGSIGNIPIAVPGLDLGNTVAGVPLEINVLIDNYWDVNQVLLH